MTYAEASDTCRSQGGNLVSIFDESYQHIVEALIAAHNDTTIWTGGRLFSRDLSQQWAWLSSKTKECYFQTDNNQHRGIFVARGLNSPMAE